MNRTLAILMALAAGLLAVGIAGIRWLTRPETVDGSETMKAEFRRLVAAGDAALARNQTFGAIENFSGALALKSGSMLAQIVRRVSEAIGLDREDLSLDGGFVRVIGKGDKERLVPVGRLAVGGETPEAVCELPPITHTFSSDAQLGDLLRQRRPIFDHVYQRLRPLFREFPA